MNLPPKIPATARVAPVAADLAPPGDNEKPLARKVGRYPFGAGKKLINVKEMGVVMVTITTTLKELALARN